MKITFTYKGIRYRDYELLTPNIDYINSNSNYCLGVEEYNLLHNDISNPLKAATNGVVPPDGSALYIAQPCPLCNADIRKNYTIKRSPENADYCVISPLTKYAPKYASFATAIVPKYKQLFCFFGRQYAASHSMRAHVEYCIPTIDYLTDVIEIPELFYILQDNLSDFHISYINDEITKPVAYYESLNMDTGNKLSLDLLYLVYTTAHSGSSKDDYEKLVLQLESLNQHNWRDYPGTIGILLKDLCRSGKTYYYWAYSDNKLPKAVKQFAYRNFPYTSPKDMSHDDFNMARDLLMMLLGLDNTIYATLDSTINKIQEFSIRPDLLSQFFDVAVRIAPKTTNS